MLATQTPQHHHLAEVENDNEEEMTNGDADQGSGGDVSRDLDTDEHIKDPVEDRRTLAERNERLHDQLKVNFDGLSNFLEEFSFKSLLKLSLIQNLIENFLLSIS